MLVCASSLPVDGSVPIRFKMLVDPVVGVSPTRSRQYKHWPIGFLSVSPWDIETLHYGSVLHSKSLLCYRDLPLSEPSEVCRYR